MYAKVLIDNIAEAPLQAEWGLAVYIEYRGTKILLDSGASPLFLENAALLGVDPAEIELAVLSHAHFDHSLGLRAFFTLNAAAPLYVRAGAAENCYEDKEGVREYIGIDPGLLTDFKDRIRYAEGDLEILPGAWLIPHKTPGLEARGEMFGMYVRENGVDRFDDFAHEQSLVLETEKGLFIFNCCSHGGADNILREVGETFPDKKIYAIFGGFHLCGCTEEQIRALAAQLRALGVERIITGHCSEERGVAILREELGEQVEQIRAGLVLEV